VRRIAPVLRSARVALAGALQQGGPFGDIPGERGRAAELGGRLIVAAEPGQQVAADPGQVVVIGQDGGGQQPLTVTNERTLASSEKVPPRCPSGRSPFEASAAGRTEEAGHRS
jgi:hypothetical protein